MAALLAAVIATIIWGLASARFAPRSAVALSVAVVTNEYGFPIAELAVANRSGSSLFYHLETEALTDGWSEVPGAWHAGSLGPGETSKHRIGHPIAEGKWRVRMKWQRHPLVMGLYPRLKKLFPMLGRYYEREHLEFSEPIEAWQPPEVR